MSQTPQLKNPWTILETETKYDNPWISVEHNEVLNPVGNKGIYGVVHFKNKAIGVIPVDKNGFTYLVGQFRFPLNQYHWEIPEGGGPLAENPLAAAQRELLEETGMKAADWKQLGEAYLSNSVCDEHAIFYLATELSQHEAEPEDTEQLSIKKIAVQELFEMAYDGRITDALSLLAIQKLHIMYLKGAISF